MMIPSSFVLMEDDELMSFRAAITLSAVSIGAGVLLVVATVVAERYEDRW